MFSIVRIILLILFASSMILGGLGVQQGDSSFLKGGAGLLAVALLLIVVYKIIWKAIGCLIIIGILAIGSFMMFSGSGNMPDLGSLGGMMSTISNEKKADASQTDEQIEALSNQNVTSPNLIKPNVTDSFGASNQDVLEHHIPQEYAPQEVVEEPQAVEQPVPHNSVSGVARVINGDTIQIGNRIIRFFGVDAPEPNQTCADRNGSSYRCGQKAAEELRKMLGNSEVTCTIMQQNNRGHAIGTCAVGAYDVGAALVFNGWALAYRQYSGDVYVPYENSARSQQLGLWEGEFYMPWDWREHNTMQKKAAPSNMITMPDSRSGSSTGANFIGSLLKMF